MATIRHHAHIDRSPDEVWKVVADAGAISSWFPGIDTSSGTVDVLPDGDGALIIYSTDVLPDEAKAVIDRVIAGGIEGLKSHLES